jgi:hypothetical protein
MFHFARQRLSSPMRLLLFFLAFGPPIVMAGLSGSLGPVTAGAGMFALIFTAGAVGQDMSSGVLQLLFARPVARTTYVLSRWLTGGLIGGVLGIAQVLLATMAIMARGGTADPSQLARLILENAITGFGTAAVMVMLSTLVNGLGDVALWVSGLLVSQMLGLTASAKQWEWMHRVADELKSFLQPDLSLAWVFGNGDLSWAAFIRFFATIAVGLAIAVTLMQRKELSYAAD